MNWKTKERTLTRIVSHDAEELSDILSKRIFAARIRPRGDARDFSFDLTAYYFDFFFEVIVPGGGVLTKAEGVALSNYNLLIAQEGAVDLKAGSGRVASVPGTAGFIETPTFRKPPIPNEPNLRRSASISGKWFGI